MKSRFVDWYLVRHAPVAGAKQGIYRSLDGAADLSDTTALDVAAKRLPTDARWWTSPMRRTRETASALADRIPPQPAPAVEERLREQDFGAWHGLTFEELWKKIRDLPPHNWSYLAPETTPPDGENYLVLWERAASFIEERTRESSSAPLVLVTHAGVIRAIVGQALGLTPSRALALGIATLSVTKLTQSRPPTPASARDRGGDWEIRYLNRA